MGARFPPGRFAAAVIGKLLALTPSGAHTVDLPRLAELAARALIARPSSFVVHDRLTPSPPNMSPAGGRIKAESIAVDFKPWPAALPPTT